MPTKTRECPTSELLAEIRTVINSLLGEEEPLFCYETEDQQSGILGYHSFHVLVITKSEIIKLSRYSSRLGLFSIVYLNEIVRIEERESEDSSKTPEIHIYGTKDFRLMDFSFENKRILYSFTQKLRQAISKANKMPRQ